MTLLYKIKDVSHQITGDTPTSFQGSSLSTVGTRWKKIRAKGCGIVNLENATVAIKKTSPQYRTLREVKSFAIVACLQTCFPLIDTNGFHVKKGLGSRCRHTLTFYVVVWQTTSKNWNARCNRPVQWLLFLIRYHCRCRRHSSNSLILGRCSDKDNNAKENVIWK